MQSYQRINHPFGPLYDKNSEILILGSFPSVKSREQQFFYGHPQNRFWKVTAGVLSVPVPQTIEEKKAMLHENHIALWDVIAECEIIGSSDSSIRNVTPHGFKSDSGVCQNPTDLCEWEYSKKNVRKISEKDSWT